MKKTLLAISLVMLFPAAHAQSLQDQLATIDQVQQQRIADEQAAIRKAEAEQKAEEERIRKEYEAQERKEARVRAAASARAAAREKVRAEAAQADKKREQGYEDQLRELEIERQKAELEALKAKSKRANDYIDRELQQQDAQTDSILAKADATRNVSEGAKSKMTSEGKAQEKKATSWFSSDK